MSRLSIEQLEKYVFAEDKDAFLKTVTPYTEAYYLVELVNEFHKEPQNQEKIESLATAFLSNKKLDSQTQDLIRLKKLLNDYKLANGNVDKVKKVLAEINARFLNLQFDYTNPLGANVGSTLASGNGPAPVSTLPEDIKSRQTLDFVLTQLYKSRTITNLNKINKAYYHRIDLSKFDPKKDRDLLIRIIEGHENLSADPHILAVATALEKEHPNQNTVRNSIWRSLTVEQKEQLLGNQAYFNSPNLLEDFVRLKFKISKAELSGQSLDKKEAAYKALLKYGTGLPEKYRHFARLARYKLLKYQHKQGLVDEAMLLDYLKDPITSFAFFSAENSQRIQRQQQNSINNFGVVSYDQTKDQKVIEEMLKALVAKGRPVAPFLDFFDYSYLTKLEATAKAISKGDIEEAKKALDEKELDKLFNDKYLTILPGQPKRFEAGQEVSVGLKLKNVQRLQVRVFQLNTLNFLRENLNPQYEKVELSGLVPVEEYEHTYQHQQLLEHIETFKFQSIQDREFGVFVVDFISGELNSRAVIYRGSLTLVGDRATGRKLHLLSEGGLVCVGPDTGLYIGGKFFQADSATGEIQIPLNVAATSQRVIVTHNGFADTSELRTKDPEFRLTSSLLFNSEQFAPGIQAEFILSLQFLINLERVSLELLSNVAAAVTFTNSKGVVSRSELKSLKLANDKDLVLSAIFPPKADGVTVNLTAEYKYGEKTQKLSSESKLAISRPGTNSLTRLLFKKSAAGELTLHAVGRNGEPRANIQINLQIQSVFTSEPEKVLLTTDASGKVSLGAFDGLDCIYAQCPDAAQSYAELERESRTYSLQMTVCEGEEIRLPVDSQGLKMQLLWISDSGSLYRDITASSLKVAGNSLTVTGLEKGRYTLKINQQKISIQVLSGVHVPGSRRLVRTRDAFVDLPVATGGRFTRVASNADSVTVELASASRHTRAHLLTYNFFQSDLNKIRRDVELFSDSAPKSSPVESVPNRRENYYFSGRRLNDEVIYVNDRKTKLNFMGNTLEKPGTLLKRHRVGETSETDQQANAGEKFKEASESKKMERMRKEMMYDRQPTKGSQAACPVIDAIVASEFLQNPGKMVANLPLVDGKLVIPASLYTPYACSFVVLADELGSAILPVHTSDATAALKDTRLAATKKANHIYRYARQVKASSKGQTAVIDNIQNTDHYIVKSLKDVEKVLFLLQPQLAGQLAEWGFLADWAALEPMEKLRKYDKFASHELNLFLRFKDPEFFEGVVKPFLANKYEKTLVDHFLLNNHKAAEQWQSQTAFATLNVLELVLLAALTAQHAPDFSKSVRNHLKDRAVLNKPSEQVREAYFERILSDKQADPSKPTPPPPAPAQPTASNQNMRLRMNANMVRGASGFAMQSQLDRGERLEMLTLRQESLQADSRSFGQRAQAHYSANRGGQARFMDTRNDDMLLMDAPLPTAETEIFIPSKGTIEYNEKKYFFGSFNSSVQEFWSDAASHLSEHGSNKGFLSGNFLFGVTTASEAIAALAFLDFGFEAAAVETSAVGWQLKIMSDANILILTNEIVEQPGETGEMDILCAQRFFDPNDRFVYDDQNANLKIERNIDEFVAGKVYGCRVVVTNSSASDLNLSLVAEVPQGAVPLSWRETTRIESLLVGSFQSSIQEFFFYFPSVGSFGMYPATVIKGDSIVAVARAPAQLVVEQTKRSAKLETISDILAVGSKADILDFLRSKNVFNLKVVSWPQLYWLLKDEAFWRQVVGVCKERGFWDPTVWSFAFLHGDGPLAAEFLASPTARPGLPQLPFSDSPLLRFDIFEIKEYYPLINPRAHVLGQGKANIINDTFRKTYHFFLNYLFLKPRPSVQNLALLANYLIVQDRVEEAAALSARIDASAADLETRIQFDYQRAYLDFLTGFPKFATVKAICEQYLTYPILSWRNLFVEMANQLAEFEEVEVQSRVKTDKEAETANKDKASRASSFTAELEGPAVKIVAQNLASLGVRYFKFDPEVLFSLSPFEFESGASFKFVQPFSVDSVTFTNPKELTVLKYPVPPKLANECFFIEVFSQSAELTQSTWLSYLPFSLGLQQTAEFGIVKIFDPATHRPVPKVYVKCFSKSQIGAVAFYKDGYTDLRGSFDYVSLNSDKLSDISKFAILVVSEQHGAKVLYCDPPARIGRVEGEIKNLISDKWRHLQSKAVNGSTENLYKNVIK